MKIKFKGIKKANIHNGTLKTFDWLRMSDIILINLLKRFLKIAFNIKKTILFMDASNVSAVTSSHCTQRTQE